MYKLTGHFIRDACCVNINSYSGDCASTFRHVDEGRGDLLKFKPHTCSPTGLQQLCDWVQPSGVNLIKWPYLDGVIVGLACFCIRLVRHEPRLQQVLVEAVPESSDRGVICRDGRRGGGEAQNQPRRFWVGFPFPPQQPRRRTLSSHFPFYLRDVPLVGNVCTAFMAGLITARVGGSQQPFRADGKLPPLESNVTAN